MTIRFNPFAIRTFTFFATLSPIVGQSTGKDPEKKPRAFKIGVLLPLTGQLADYGSQLKGGADHAIGVLKKQHPQAQVLIQNTQSTPQGAAEAANQLVAKKVDILVGELDTGNTLAAASIAKEKKIPIISIASTHSTLTAGNPYLFRVCFTDDFQGHVLAKFAATPPLKAKQAVLLTDKDSAYSKGLAANFKKEFESQGGKVVLEMEFSKNESDFKNTVNKVRKAKADVLFVPAFQQQVAPLLRELKLQRVKIPVLGSDSWDTPGLLQLAKDAADGSYYATHFAADTANPIAQTFAKDYTAAHKQKEAPTTYAVLSYDAVMLAANALANSQNTEGALSVLGSPKGYSGISGDLTMDKDRNPSNKEAYIIKVEKGRPVLFKRVAK